jgi:shikimate kinase
MPGVGKSTTGVLLAKRLAKDYLDTDLIIQNFTCEPLRDTIERIGASAFLSLEERCVLWCDPRNSVIATGGSVVYSDAAMEHLASNGTVVHLSMEYDNLRLRLDDLDQRGVLMEPGQGLRRLYEERMPLYQSRAACTVWCDGLSASAVADRVMAELDEKQTFPLENADGGMIPPFEPSRYNLEKDQPCAE